MKKNIQNITLLSFGLWCLGMWSLSAQNMRYGFEQGADNPLRITAVAIPDFTSDNVTISTAVFSFALSSSIVITPSMEVVPARGTLENHTGSWSAQKITPEVYSSAGLNADDLEGNTVYQLVLRSAPQLTGVEAGQAIPLFSFELLSDCQEGSIEVLTNQGPIRNALFESLHANFNNQISVSIDDAPAMNVFEENDPFSAQIECPLLLVSNENLEVVEPSIEVHPNPAKNSARVVLKSNLAGPGELILYDMRYREVFRQRDSFIVGTNIVIMDVEDLALGNYLLVGKIDDLVLRTKLIKIAP